MEINELFAIMCMMNTGILATGNEMGSFPHFIHILVSYPDPEQYVWDVLEFVFTIYIEVTIMKVYLRHQVPILL